MRFELTLTMKAAACSPSPRNGSVVIPTAGNRMRGLSERAAAFILAEGPRERGTDVR